MTTKPIFPPESQVQLQAGQYKFLIGSACVLGALLIIVMFVVQASFNLYFKKQFFTGGSCCGPAEFVPIEEMKAGTDFNLYGKTLDNEDFNWESLRGKYVLVKFTATWCGPCKSEIPGMLEAYEHYHDEGLEIVSVYIWQSESDPAATVKKFVEHEKLPWIIILESLTEASDLPPQGKTFAIQSVPTMLLIDKEGKVLATETRGPRLRQELQKLFGT